MLLAVKWRVLLGSAAWMGHVPVEEKSSLLRVELLLAASLLFVWFCTTFCVRQP